MSCFRGGAEAVQCKARRRRGRITRRMGGEKDMATVTQDVRRPGSEAGELQVSLPVRTGEEPWQEQDLTEVREQLEVEAQRLAQEIRRAQSDLAEWLAESVDTAGDDAGDTGATAYQREQDLALTYNSRELLAQTRRALERIGAGTYGACESCGDAIGKARLQVFPRATQCVACKQREERR
jgi:DnaK suppressor protein